MKFTTVCASLLWLGQANSFTVSPLQPRQQFKAEVFSTEEIIPTDRTVKIESTPVPTGTREVLPGLPEGVAPQTTGTVYTDISSRRNPLLTSSIPEPRRLLKPVASPTLEAYGAEMTTVDMDKRQSADIFANPIGTNGPPSQIPRRSDHPVSHGTIVKNGVLSTNKFYAGFHLGSQTDPIYPFPYALQWPRGGGVARSWGISISHSEERQRVFGADKFNGAAEYYLNPVGIQSMILSAVELGSATVMQLEDVTAFSARAVLRPSAGAAPAVSFPLVQGMPYVTGQFTGGRPMIQTGVFFRSMTRVQNDPKSGVAKYNFLLEDGTTWIVYGYATSGSMLDLQLVNQGLAQSRNAFTGVVQVVKNPGGADSALDDGAGIYPTGVRLSGSVAGSSGSYSLNFSRAGHSQGKLYMYALPHHVESFNSDTAGRTQSIRLVTLTKGQARLVRGSSWTMLENSIPTSMDFAPWDGTTKRTLSNAAKSAILPIARSDISQNMDAQSNLDSMYFSGKALAKFAQIVYLTNDLLGDAGLAQAGLNNLKAAFNRFASNRQQYPLVYESAWGGVVSSASYTTGDANADFGNAYYNDHHFHYGYHILAAAYIGHLDRNWITSSRDYVNMLVRDVANPSTSDTWFPQWRNFDWYHGHSWAHGLYPSADGKNQESSSEDTMAAYAIKMWGTVIGDADMVARANLMLAVQTRSFRNYYYYENNNPTQPARFIGNKVAGILFENKIHHTTFFSPDIEAIQGIHMIPVHGPTGLVRNKNFIREEWDAFFSNGRVDRFDNPWKGIAYAQYALVNPQTAWSFFASGSFQDRWIDGGASRSWYMAYAAALGGA
ncbi:endo-1,3(4)-beta-glucanase [Emericellopsis atlantica]|uniref:glucan endo-1,3-beta-D-glucosidase n=1 Tax=Emericellopsis atlantica TaxID=2614577 RepID=A0A9P7ZRX1_9HYPO|nr:endo-1,3(4)-beta-glucanase [Emericellopsis atlantica]KAG9256533.1 endo-1,3(4)-beta-glucanase [Emericellopsis atlantica]